MALLEGVEDVVCGGDVGFSADLGFGDAEKAHDVGAVGVEVLAVIC